MLFFFFQAEDGIRDLVRSRGLGDVYKRQGYRYLFLEKVDLTENDGRDEHNLGEYEFNHDLSGVIFKLGFSYSIEL